MIKLVVVDFDDTLCLTEDACFELENLVAGKMGFAPMTRELHLQTWSHSFREMLPIRFPGINVDEFFNNFIEENNKFIAEEKIDVISEINLETLGRLRKAGCKTAILTARELFEVEHLLHKDHILGKHIDVFYHKNNTQFHKPDPRALTRVIDDFNMLPAQTVYIGDHINDAICAKGAGAHFIALMESGIRKKKDFAKIKVDYFASKFPDILKYILPENKVVQSDF